ncbi:MAG TPA: cell division protein ZapA [Ruminococcus sp.]|nr:cell division protein ZapA [Ruminococcus sp.]
MEKKINEITSSNTNVSQASAAVMVAFMAIDELNQTNRNLDNLRGELKEYVDEADRVTSERDNAVRELEIIKTKISQLEGNKKLKQLKDSI